MNRWEEWIIDDDDHDNDNNNSNNNYNNNNNSNDTNDSNNNNFICFCQPSLSSFPRFFVGRPIDDNAPYSAIGADLDNLEIYEGRRPWLIAHGHILRGKPEQFEIGMNKQVTSCRVKLVGSPYLSYALILSLCDLHIDTTKQCERKSSEKKYYSNQFFD